MNSQDFRNLQEAYLDVYQEEVLDEVRGGGEIDPVSDIPGIGLRGARSPRDAGLQMSPLDRAKLRANALEKRNDPKAKKRASDMNKNFIRPTEKAVNRSLLAATNARHAEKTRLMNPQESYNPDLFDVILEYLIIEGYADTNENALVIMANMSEDWRDDILNEGIGSAIKSLFSRSKPKQSRGEELRSKYGSPDSRPSRYEITLKSSGKEAAKKVLDAGGSIRNIHPRDTGSNNPGTVTSGEYKGRGNSANRRMGKPPENTRDQASLVRMGRGSQVQQGHIDSRGVKKPIARINASYEPDLFDVILEYLIIEGYADTNENALVIMANMSEEWRDSIVEEKIVRSGVSVNAAGQKIPWTHSHNTATGKSTVKDKFGKRDASVSAKIKPKMD